MSPIRAVRDIAASALAAESRLGNYGTYFGTHEQGRVAPVAERKHP
ncbi:MAG: hypothetical protein U5N10_04570 [Gemmobacter sp.]|nr:hypothetical protein [Gemmobacter sp.]